MKAIIFFLLVGSSFCLENSGSADDNVWKTFLHTVGIMADLYPDFSTQCRVDFQHDYTFECDPGLTAGPPATSVHALRPHDISVVGAMGDSLTAGFGSDACDLSDLVNEYRGRSWPVGGDETIDEVSTLPNIIKKFNPNLKGYSTGIAGFNSEEAAFNTAISGARSEHMIFMTNEMIHRMKASEEINFEADWKVVSVFIGANDLCQYCFNFHKYSAEQYVQNLQDALDMMHREMPRTLVNVQGILRVTDVDHLSSLKCDLIHFVACNCAAFKEGDKHQELLELIMAYQKGTEDLIMSGRYDTRDDFTVVYQPYLTNTRFPLLPNLEGDGSYFAPDCFHFSAKGHATMAKELWNNMLEPVGEKSDTWNPPENIRCPTKKEPYIFTNMNSNIDTEKYPYYADAAGSFVHISIATMLLSLVLFYVFTRH